MLLSSTNYQKYANVFRIAPVPNSPTPPYTISFSEKAVFDLQDFYSQFFLDLWFLSFFSPPLLLPLLSVITYFFHFSIKSARRKVGLFSVSLFSFARRECLSFSTTDRLSLFSLTLFSFSRRECLPFSKIVYDCLFKEKLRITSNFFDFYYAKSNKNKEYELN